MANVDKNVRRGKRSRRLGCNLSGRENDAFVKRSYPPGAHGASIGYRGKTNYGKQLCDKQRLKWYYDISEKQLRKLYDAAVRFRGDTGERLVQLLESRLDVFIWRMFAPWLKTKAAARQFVLHKHVSVNGRVVNIPSAQLRPGDKVKIVEKASQLKIVQDGIVQNENYIASGYMMIDSDMKGATYIKYPSIADDIRYHIPMDLQSVIEFYSAH